MKDRVLNDLAVAMLACYHALEHESVKGTLAVFDTGKGYAYAELTADMEAELVAIDTNKLSFTKLGNARTADLVKKATYLCSYSEWAEIAAKIKEFGGYNPNNGDIAEIAYKLAINGEPEKGKKRFYKKSCECFKAAADVNGYQVKYLSSNCTLCNLSTITRTYTDGETPENIKTAVERAIEIEKSVKKYKGRA